MSASRSEFHIAPEYQPILREIGIDADAIFDHPNIVAWRKLPDRENCTLDAISSDGKKIRWHVKRHLTPAGASAVDDEVKGIQLLADNGIPTVPLVGWGFVSGRGAFVITEDLSQYKAADKLIAAGTPFDQLIESSADLAAKLHNAGLHHRDLYLCHFFAEMANPANLRIIDAARVKRLPQFSLFQKRWLVKDLGQFWYSTLSLPITDQQRDEWLNQYCRQRNIGAVDRLKRSIERKARSIGRHDARTRRKYPTRNVSIPESA